MNAYILTIGDELLIGQVIDSNAAWMAQQLNLAGLAVVESLSVADTTEGITEGLVRALEKADLVLMTGGLGPTKDDITKKTLADFFGVGMVFDQASYDRILRLFERWGRSTTEAHRLQCFMPENAELLENKMGTAPGMWFERDGKVVVSMPGVPYEMKYIVEHGVLPRAKERFVPEALIHRTIRTVGEGESRIARRIESIEKGLPDHIKLAFLPSLGQVRLRLSGRGGDEAVLSRELDKQVAAIQAAIPELIFGYDNETLEEVIGRMLTERQWMMATAESCTGGYVAHRITSIPGSSRYYQGSAIVYANELKVSMLGVSEASLMEHGAVSEAVVRQMVEGACQALKTDVAIATSGIAGPGGGTAEKPVGTIWLAAGRPGQVISRKLSLGKDRLRNIEYTSTQALNLLRTFLLEEESGTAQNAQSVSPGKGK
ncbi:MAG: competence/damage-inducible protein A [Bacteroidota bacterium]